MENNEQKLVDWFTTSDSQLFTLKGYAGCGKTTLARRIPEILGLMEFEVAYLAPTGRAASIISKHGQTIHSFMYSPIVNGEGRLTGFRRKPKDEIAYVEVIICDEFSMINGDVYRDLISLGIKIIAIGDPMQLPPIGSTTLFHTKKPDILLTKVYRNDGGILQLATDLRNNSPISESYDNVDFRQGAQLWNDLTLDYMYICKFNKTRATINNNIRMKNGYSGIVNVGERLICVYNNRDKNIFNGQILIVKMVVRRKKYSVVLEVETESGEITGIESPIWHLENSASPKKTDKDKVYVNYAYAITCHKAQGSSFENVAVVNEGSWFDEHDKWVYTAVTRASKKLIFYNS